jgi:Ca-activated chloride channel family protein
MALLMRPRFTSSLAALAAAAPLLAAVSAGAQQKPQPPTFRVNVDLVTVDVSVMRKNVPVTGLTERNFVITDNGARQQLLPVSAEQAPLDAWLVLDTSGSVGAELPQLVRAGRAFVDGLSARDRAALIGFSDTVRVPQMPTSDLEAVRQAFEALESRGATALYDATYVALRLRQPSARRGVVVVLTDGYDNSSWLAADRLVELAERSDVIVYGVAVTPGVRDASRSDSREPPRTPQFRFLRGLADASGGRVFDAGWSELESTFAGILREIRTRYLLTYYPTSTAPGWHRIEVKLTGVKGDVIARRGYWTSRPGQSR